MLPEPLSEAIAPALRQVLETGQPVMGQEMTWPSLAVPPVGCVWRVSYYPVHDDQGRLVGVSAAVQDITSHKQALAALSASEERLTDFLESTHDSFFALDHEWRILYINQQYANKLGLVAGELIGRNFWEAFPRYLGTSSETYFRQVMAERTPAHFQASGRYTDQYYEISVYPIREGISVFSTDRTEQHQVEAMLREHQATLQEYAFRLERSNQDLQEFAYVASHDLQEPLRKIAAFGNALLASAGTLDEKERDYLNRMRTAAERMRLMIEDLLALSRISSQGRPFVWVDLALVTEEILSDLEIQLQRTGGQVAFDHLPVVEADPAQMRQLLQNLIGNALKYHQPGQPPVVRLSSRRISAKRVEILVEDNGIGFDPAYAERIFQPFQRLVGKSEYEGNGIGLAICKRIVERHGGSIHARSTPGVGSAFIVELPEQR